MKQRIAVVRLTDLESSIVNKRKSNPAKHWTHKVVCGEHATFLQIGEDVGLAKMVLQNWPEVFSEISNSVPPNAQSVEKADRRYLTTLENKFGNPTDRKIKEAQASIEKIIQSVPPNKGSIWKRLLGQ
jgi:hypothetical protein